MTMGASTAGIDYESLAKANARLFLAIPKDHIHIITRLANNTWFAHLTRTTEDLTKTGDDIPVLHESGRTLPEVLIKLHSATSKLVEAHFQDRQFNLGPKSGLDDPKGEEYESEDDLGSIYSESDDGSEVAPSRPGAKSRTVPIFERPPRQDWTPFRVPNPGPRGHPIPRNPQAPEPKPARPFQPSSTINNRNPTSPGFAQPLRAVPPRQHTEPPPPNPVAKPPSPVPSHPARIRIDFINHGTYEIAETIPTTQNDVLTAATRHCDMLMGIKCLRANLRSVSRGGTKILVQGCVTDLVAMVRALPDRSEVPLYEVEVTKSSST